MKNLVKLGELTTIKTGKLDANASTPNGDYPFFTCAIKPLKISSYSYDCECVLVAGNGDLNVKYYCGKFDAYQRTYIIEVKNKEKLLTKYLYYFLQLYISLLRNQSIGGVIKYIKLNNLTDLQINVPLLSEQQKIISIIEQISTLTAKRNQQLEKLDLLVQAKFVEMFGVYDLRNRHCNWFPIGLLAEVVGGSTPKTEIAEYWNGENPWITPAEIDDNSFIIKNTQRQLSDAGIKSCSLRLMPVGTVLLSSRAPIGKVAIAGVEMFCNQGFKNLICSDKLNPIFVYYLLKFNTKYLNSLGRGATFKEISKSIVENIYIPAPNKKIQNKFAHFVEQTENIKSKIKQSLEKLEILKQSLLQKYFG